MNRIKPRISR